MSDEATLLPGRELHNLIVELTESGKSELDPTKFKKITKLCKKSNQIVSECYDLCIRRLQAAHSQIRLSTMQIIDLLFYRSHHFRTLVSSNFEMVANHTNNIDSSNCKLPLPKSFAEELSRFSCRCFVHWNEKFGDDYSKLRIGVNYLKQALKLQMKTADESIQDSREAEERERKRLEGQKLKLINDVTMEVTNMEQEILMSINCLQSCFDILLPNITDDIFDGEAVSQPAVVEGDNMRECGVLQHGVVLELNMNVQSLVRENSDNRDVIQTIKEHIKLLQTRFVPKLNRWSAVLNQCHCSDSDATFVKVKKLMSKCSDKLSSYDRLKLVDNDVESDDDFEDVCTSNLEYSVIGSDVEEDHFFGSLVNSKVHTLRRRKSATSTEEVNLMETWKPIPVSSSTTSKDPTVGCRPGLKRQRTADVAKLSGATSDQLPPVLPYGIDLQNWGQPGTSSKFYRMDDGQHMYGYRPSAGDEEVEVPGSADVLSLRTFTLPVQNETISRTCRHPLHDGTLCSRKDKFKCPFHGIIRNRTSSGDLVELSHNLVLKHKPKKNLKKRSSGLVNIKKIVDNPRSRVERKVTNKMAIRRVAQDMEQMRAKKIEEKFGNQFQYQNKLFIG